MLTSCDATYFLSSSFSSANAIGSLWYISHSHAPSCFLMTLAVTLRSLMSPRSSSGSPPIFVRNAVAVLTSAVLVSPVGLILDSTKSAALVSDSRRPTNLSSSHLSDDLVAKMRLPQRHLHGIQGLVHGVQSLLDLSVRYSRCRIWRSVSVRDVTVSSVSGRLRVSGRLYRMFLDLLLELRMLAEESREAMDRYGSPVLVR